MTEKKKLPSPPRYYVLVIEDDPSIRELLRVLLEHHGCHVTACANGQAATAACMKAGRSYDAIVMDMVLPDTSGLALMAQLRQTSGGANAPVLCVSARIDEATRQQAFAKGCAMYLTKPFSGRDLIWALERVATHPAIEPAM